MSSECLFCRIVSGALPTSVVHESDSTFAFRDLHPQASSHVLVVPRVHYSNAVELAEARPELMAELTLAAGEIAVLEGIAESGYRLVYNTGPDAGQTVFHVHLHVLGGEQLGLFGRP